MLGTEPSMSTKTSTVENSHGTRSIEAGRFDRAVTSAMDIDRVADRLYRVATESGTYDVDLVSGACTCPDWQYWDDLYVCKHAIRAALVDVYRARKARSALAARVIAFAIANDCPAATRGCNGPFRAHDDGLLPCPTCCDAVRSAGVDEFDVWKIAVSEDRR